MGYHEKKGGGKIATYELLRFLRNLFELIRMKKFSFFSLSYTKTKSPRLLTAAWNFLRNTFNNIYKFLASLKVHWKGIKTQFIFLKSEGCFSGHISTTHWCSSISFHYQKIAVQRSYCERQIIYWQCKMQIISKTSFGRKQ